MRGGGGGQGVRDNTDASLRRVFPERKKGVKIIFGWEVENSVADPVLY